MAKLLALFIIGLVCVIVNVRGQTNNKKPLNGQAFDEVVVSSDLIVKRKSKENRQGKRLLTNVPSGTTGPPSKPTVNTSRLISSDGSRISSGNRNRRENSKNRLLDLGVAGYLLNSRKR
ncbi:uncharacterized protein [Venturia canescens]|uniref:uncharacterized protein n=1 Tax=Venturia canescens TaxID=32260 RepID=UPI001C9BC99A|nr:uncharacterized protein LOC122417969 [Venturia canescens]